MAPAVAYSSRALQRCWSSLCSRGRPSPPPPDLQQGELSSLTSGVFQPTALSSTSFPLLLDPFPLSKRHKGQPSICLITARFLQELVGTKRRLARIRTAYSRQATAVTFVWVLCPTGERSNKF